MDNRFALVDQSGKRYWIGSGGMSLGRHRTCGIVVSDPSVSRLHTRLFLAKGRCWIRDEDSRAGTFVNGRRITAQQPLLVGDVLQVGPATFRLEGVDPLPGTVTVTRARDVQRRTSITLVGIAGVSVAILLIALAKCGSSGDDETQVAAVSVPSTPTLTSTAVPPSDAGIPSSATDLAATQDTASPTPTPSATQTILPLPPTKMPVQQQERPPLRLPMPAKCPASSVRVTSSTLNVRNGPGAGRGEEAIYSIKSYLVKDECVRVSGVNVQRTWVVISDAPRSSALEGWVAVEYLEFGEDHTPAGSLPITATPVLPPTPTPIPDADTTSIGPVGIEHLAGASYVCYNIQGSDGYQLAEEMHELGPYTSDGKKAIAIAGYQFDTSGGACYRDGTADLSDVTVSVNSTITMPCWYPPTGTSPAEITKFDSFMRRVAVHELRHVEIAWQYARILELRIREVNSCGEALATVYDQVMADEEAAQDAFHASPAGRPVPYP